ncbi:hypothetical protein PybrP1_012804 [[Pythium] brassicae (nom. inval.)]|nr:hypothetical protein PybrP1_012804 [[Pythium] brassicae (nom. inval.)]
MAHDVLAAYERAHLKRRFQAASPFGINNPQQFKASSEEIAGRLAGDNFLSDVTVAFVLHKVCLGLDSCYVLDPIHMTRRAQYTPVQHLSTVSMVLMPINLENVH